MIFIIYSVDSSIIHTTDGSPIYLFYDYDICATPSVGTDTDICDLPSGVD